MHATLEQSRQLFDKVGVCRIGDQQPQNASLATEPYNQWGPVYWDPNAGKVGNTQQWNFNIQRELPGNMVFDIG